MNRIEFVNLINRPDTIEEIQRYFVNYMALYNLIGRYNISQIIEEKLKFTISFYSIEDLQNIYNALPNDMYMYNSKLKLNKSIINNSIIIEFV